MAISFDKRLELIFGLLYSVNKDYDIPPKGMYIDELPNYCKEFYNLYKQNVSDSLIEYIRKGGFDTYDRTVRIALALNENYNLIENDSIIEIKKNNPNFNSKELETLLMKFVNDSKYEEFYMKHLSFYNKIEESFKSTLNAFVKFDEKLITDFYGYKIYDMKILLYNFTTGSCGIKNNNEILYIQRVENLNNDEYNAKFKTNKILNFFHEFSHPYFSPLVEKYFKNIDMNNLYDVSKANGLQDCYRTPLGVINEYCVRAATVYLGNKYLSKEDMETHIYKQKNSGFNYITELSNLFHNKDNYSSFEEFFKNEIVIYLKKLN